MRSFLPLLGKELRALFYSPIAYIIIAVFLVLMGYSFTLTLFLNKFATLIHIFFQSAGLLFLLIPIITMRLFAEERKAGTLELLLTAPVRESQVVLAKYVASMAVVLAMIALTALMASYSQRSAPRILVRSTVDTSALRSSPARWCRSV
jgi:ABC-2 type transport system permease protein